MASDKVTRTSKASIATIASKLDKLELNDDERAVFASVMRLAAIGLEKFVPACKGRAVEIDAASTLRAEWRGDKPPRLSEAFVEAFAPSRTSGFSIEGLVVDASLTLPAMASKRGMISCGSIGGIMLAVDPPPDRGR